MEKTELQLKVINIIRELRLANKLSQAGFADIIGVSYGLVGNIESTKFRHKYTIEQLKKATDYFGFPFQELFLTKEELVKPKNVVIETLINKICDYDR